MSDTHTALYDPHCLFGADTELPLDRSPSTA
jgi:hypothetical protein